MLAYLVALTASPSITGAPSTSPAAGQDSASQWTAADISAQELASRCDKKLHNLQNSAAIYNFKFHVSTGEATMGGIAYIKDQRNYRLESPIVVPQDNAGYLWRTTVASGGKAWNYEERDLKDSEATPSTAPRALPKEILGNWMRQNVPILFTAVGTSANPLEALVQAAKTSSDYTVVAQQRTLENIHEGKTYRVKRYRILVQRKAAAATKQGQLYYEVVIDSKYYLPITMSNLLKMSRKQSYFTAMYGTEWNLKPASFPPRTFDLKFVHVSTRDGFPSQASSHKKSGKRK